jgi:mono/diheme cytochrome c family protein
MRPAVAPGERALAYDAARMTARAKIFASMTVVFASATAMGACGSHGIQLSSSDPYYRGAVLFSDHCSGCHTLAVVGAQGSATRIRDRLRTNGPNFNYRKENVDQVLYAIRNGGFSGAIMPQNILVGQAAQDVAAFLTKYSGLQAKSTVSAANTP